METTASQNQALSTDSSKTTTPEQALKMITDLWGAMIALFGVRWSSQFGETPDASGQWRQTLSGISRKQVSEALSEVRMSGRGWPPTAPEFREMCLAGSREKHPPFEICVVEIQNFVRSGRRDTYNLSQFVYHMVVKNLDFYNYKLLEKEYDRQKSLEIAYKATLFQLESGEKLIAPPPPETLLEKKKPEQVDTSAPKFESPISDLLKLFDETKEPKQRTEAERLDSERLERLKNDI